MANSHWKETIDVSGVYRRLGMSFAERRDATVAIVMASSWFREVAWKQVQDPEDFPSHYILSLVKNLSQASSRTIFEGYWDILIDEAEAARVFINTLA